MSDNKNIRIDLLGGASIKIPRVEIARVVLPGIEIENKRHRLVLEKGSI